MPNRQINGKMLNVPEPFAEGHVLNANEASQLNQVFAENIGNNLRATLEKAVADGKSDKDLQAIVDEYAASYEFGVRRGGSRILDPVEREARSIAETAVKSALKAKGHTLSAIAKETMEKLVAQQAAKPEVRKEAERRVKEAEKVSSINIEDLDLGGTSTAAEAEEGEAA